MKLTIIINGMGGVGKDTLCRIAAKAYRVENISAIDPIKEIAAMCGWQGEKTDRARKFLSDLKQLTVLYNDFPTVWLTERYRRFLESDDEILFVHIREPQEIAKFVRVTEGKAKTLLIRGGKRMMKKAGHYGNASDDEVENYAYNYIYENDTPLDEAEPSFLATLRKIIADAEA